MSDLTDFAKAQAAEWDTWRAATVIFHDGVRAYNEGDPVPVSNVKLYGYDRDGLVVKADGGDAGAGVVNDAPDSPANPLVTAKKGV